MTKRPNEGGTGIKYPIAEEFQKSDHESVANGEEEEEEDSTSDSTKHKRDTADWIGRPCEPPSRNKDEEAEGKE